MANIDLRPWREERRKARQNQFLVILGIFAGIAAAIGFSWNQSIQSKIDFQQTRNQYLQSKIAEIDLKIIEIESLHEQREQLIDRMTVIQSLQGDRPIIVHMFEALVTATPEGVFFESLDLESGQISIQAQADKALSISDFLRNLDASVWFNEAFMEGMESLKEGQDVIGHKFKVRVNLFNPAAEQEQSADGAEV